MTRGEHSIFNTVTTDFNPPPCGRCLKSVRGCRVPPESTGVVKARYVWSVTSLGGYVDSLILRDADMNNDRGVR